MSVCELDGTAGRGKTQPVTMRTDYLVKKSGGEEECGESDEGENDEHV
jgi:hypothetical protein